MAAEQLTIALDANGADAGPAEVARGAALAAASGEVRVLLFGPAAEIEPAAGVEVVDARRVDREGRRPGARGARHAGVLQDQPNQRRRDEERRTGSRGHRTTFFLTPRSARGFL